MGPARRWPRIKEPFPGLSHFAGVVLSVVGLLVLLQRAEGRAAHVAGFAVYGMSLITLYLASALAHSLHCSPAAAKCLDRFDFAAIFLLIAGTYTPICLVTLRGPWGRGLLIAVWAIAASGIASLFLWKGMQARVRVATYVAMGWLALIGAGELIRAVPPAGIGWLLAGGVIYSTGAMVFLTDRPHLWPGRFAAHDLWHCMVLAGSACHFVFMLEYVAPHA